LEEEEDEQDNLRGGGGGGNIVGRIDRLERRAMRLERKDVVAMAVLFVSVVWRDSRPIDFISKALLLPFTLVFNTSTIVPLILVFLLGRSLFFSIRDTAVAAGGNIGGAAGIDNRQPQRREAQNRVRANLNAVENMLIRQREEEMMAQAIARSLRET
jgi:hypothetical protein